MPQIKEYNQKVEASGPIQNRRLTGEDLGGGLYRQIAHTGEAISSVGDAIYKRAERDEVTDATVKFAKYQADKTNELAEQVRAGTVNPEEFNNKVNEELGSLSGDYSTRAASEYVQKASAQLQSHFQVSAAAAGAEIAGTKAVVGMQEEIGHRSSVLMKEPSDYKATLQMQLDSIDAKVATGLPFKAGEELKAQARKEFGKAAVRGWMDLDPKGTQEQLKAGVWDEALSGDEKKQLMGEIQTHITAKQVEQMRIESEQRKAKEYADRDTQNTMLAQMYQGKLSTDSILKSNLDFGNKKEMLSMLQTYVEKGDKIKMDPEVFNDLYQRSLLPNDDPKKPTDMEIRQRMGDGLTLENVNQLLKVNQGDGTIQGEVRKANQKAFFDMVRGKLVKPDSIFGKDPDGEYNYSLFLNDFQKQYDEKVKAGVPESDLINPNSKDYLGTIVNKYVKNGQQMLQSRFQNDRTLKTNLDPAKAKLSNETPAQYLERMKKKDNQ